MQDAAPRGFARMPASLVSLYGWVLVVGGGCGLVGQRAQFIGLLAQHSPSWAPPIPPGEYAFNVVMLPAMAASLVAGLLLLGRRRWSVSWILAAQGLTVLAGLAAGVNALWPLVAPTAAERAYSGRVFDYIQGAGLMGAAGGVVVALVLMAWLRRFRREMLAQDAGEGERSGGAGTEAGAGREFGPIPADVVDLYGRCLFWAGVFGVLAALGNALTIHAYMGPGPHGVQGPPGVPGALYDMMLLPGAVAGLAAGAGLLGRRRWAAGWVLATQALAVIVAVFWAWTALESVNYGRFTGGGMPALFATTDGVGKVVVSVLVLRWLWRVLNVLYAGRVAGEDEAGLERSRTRGFGRLAPGVVALMGWGVLLGGAIGVVAQLPRVVWAITVVLPGYFPKDAEAKWLSLRGTLYLLVWAGAAVAGPGLRWRKRWAIDLLLGVGAAYLLVTAVSTVMAFVEGAGGHGRLPYPYNIPPYPYNIWPLTGAALKAVLVILATVWLGRFRKELRPRSEAVPD